MKKIAVLTLFLMGCAGAKVITTTAAPLGGTVQYKNGSFVRQESRELALKEMSNFCKGAYKIVSENFNHDVLSFQVNGVHHTFDKANYMYIQFMCVK